MYLQKEIAENLVNILKATEEKSRIRIRIETSRIRNAAKRRPFEMRMKILQEKYNLCWGSIKCVKHSPYLAVVSQATNPPVSALAVTVATFAVCP
jgi:hypothetical protein